MSLTSYRTAPPRAPEMLQQNAADWSSCKSFPQKSTSVDSIVHPSIYRDVNTGSSRPNIGGNGSTFNAVRKSISNNSSSYE